MPVPLPGESRDNFIDRCIPIVIDDGTAEDGSQAFAVCGNLFDEHRKEYICPKCGSDTFWDIDNPAGDHPELIQDLLVCYSNDCTWTGYPDWSLAIKQGMVAPPTNERNWTADQTREQVTQQGRQFTKEEAGYMQPADLANAHMHCNLCWFYAGLDGAGVQHCGVVSGGIEWFAHSDLFINAEQQQAIAQENAGAMEDDVDKETEVGTMEHKTLPFIVTKVDDEKGIVTHTVAVMGNVDLGNDVIHSGAFTKTISERLGQIRVLDSHNTDSIMRVIGKPIAMREISAAELPMQVKQRFPEADGALLADTQFLLNTPEGRGAFERIKAAAVAEFSIGYEAMDFDFEEREVDGVKQTIRNLRTIKLYEYSPVIFAMNPATSTVGVKAENDAKDDDAPPPEKTGDTEHDEKIGRAISAANASRMQAVIDGIQAALANLEEMLQSAPEQADMHEDEDKQESPEPPEAHQQPPNEAGPDAEPPTSKRDELLAELEIQLAEIEQMEVT